MKQKFEVSGMTCSACQRTIEKDVKNLPGINEVNISLLTNMMVVDFDESMSNQGSIIKTVKRAGYKAKAEDENEVRSPLDETSEMKKRLILSIIFFIPLIYLSMGPMIGLWIPSFFVGDSNSLLYGFTLFLLVLPILFVNFKYFTIGFKNLFRLRPNMDSLIAIGSFAAISYSILQMFTMIYGFSIGDMSLVHMASMNLYFEASGAILTLVTLGKYLESNSKGRTKTELKKLLSLAPKIAFLVQKNEVIEIHPDQIQKGDLLLVKPGMSVPVDGIITEGFSTIDESMISGEPIPVDKQPGDSVMCATLNQAGSFTFKATKVGKETSLNQIIKLVEEASMSKAPIQKLADTISGYFVPVVIGISLIGFIVWMLLGQGFSFSLSIMITILVISCPCALGLATPVAMMVGTGKGAENGILIKSADGLQKAEKINTVILDKTGTITRGVPKVTEMIFFDSKSEEYSKSILYALESYSNHPLAKSMVNYLKTLEIQPIKVVKPLDLPGKGVSGTVDGKMFYVGNTTLMKEQNINTSVHEERLITLSKQGKTVVYFANETDLIGMIALRDEIKEGSLEAIRGLKEFNYEVIMLTGDHELSALSWKDELGIDTVYADVLPDEKEAIVTKYMEQGKKVAMVGDGINDSIALVRSDIGIAIGAGSDIAIDSADIILIKNDLRDVLKALTLSKKTMNIVRMNLFWAFIYNIILIPLAFGIFYLPFSILITPVFGSLAMSLSSVTVVLNALRLKFVNLNKGARL